AAAWSGRPRCWRGAPRTPWPTCTRSSSASSKSGGNEVLRITASESLRNSGASADAKGNAPAVATAQPCSPGTTCPAPLAERPDGEKIDVDWEFISDREGGRLLKAYVPEAEKSKSGVTVGTGVDLGARSEGDIDKLEISDDLKKKLKPYAQKQRK